jgi:hypothetical protein
MYNLKQFETMKTKALFLALAILASSFAFANNPVKHETTTDCEKKVLKKIKRTMMRIDVKDYLVEDEKQLLILTCTINENQQVELLRIDGYDEEVKAAVAETLIDHPVVCKDAKRGEIFTFRLVLYHHPATI